MATNVRRALCVTLLVALFAPLEVLWGQSAAGGTITGTVEDPSQAAVPNASITLKGAATGVSLTTTSTSAGQFVFPVVPVGEYTLAVSARGFAQAVLSGVTVALNQTTTERITLKLGTTTSTVQVTASAVHLNTTTAQASTGLDQQTYSNLPLALTGAPRSPTIVADLMPGVADTPTNSSGLNEPGEAQIFDETVNGGQTLASEVYYDGVAMMQTNVAGDYRYQPVPVEALSEFTLIQNSFSAEYSRTPGGILSFNTRSGTNQWHGEAYEYNENAAFNARGFFAVSVPADRQNEFGVNVGGPIRKDKTFVFGYYSGFRYTATKAPFLTTIPTIAERSGDFSQLTVNGQLIPIYDPATTSCVGGICTRQQFPGNVIPSDRIVSVANGFNAYIPTPINSSDTNNYLGGGVSSDTYNRFGVKIDDYISDKDIIHGFYGQSPYTVFYPTQVYRNPFAGIGFNEPDDSLIFRLSQDYTFSPTLLNHVTLGINRDNATYLAIRDSSHVTFGIKNIPPITPAFCLGQYGSAGWGDPGERIIENGSGDTNCSLGVSTEGTATIPSKRTPHHSGSALRKQTSPPRPTLGQRETNTPVFYWARSTAPVSTIPFTKSAGGLATLAPTFKTTSR
jgi:Carboxypeptidase regulatory-like domain